MTMRRVNVIRHCAVVDPDAGTVAEDRILVVEDGVIIAVDEDPGTPAGGDEVDASGLFAMPGLIDCHVHAISVTKDLPSLLTGAPSYLGIAAGRLLTETAARGFTTVRDCGGADWGIAQALAEGVVPGPAVVFCGRALSQTGGQGDARRPGEGGPRDARLPDISRVVDGADAVRAAVRDEARRGAGFVKLLAEVHAHGGWRPELADDEVAAAVGEAEAWGIPVTAHAYSPERIARLVRLGVHCIEHGNALDAPALTLMAERGVDYVPTLGAFRSYAEAEGDRGIERAEQRWARDMVERGMRAIEDAERLGVRIGFGTDLTVAHERQNEEFEVRAELQPLPSLLRSATSDAARILRLEDRGRLTVGSRADLVLSRVDPLTDLAALAAPDRTHAAVVVGGRLVVDRLAER